MSMSLEPQSRARRKLIAAARASARTFAARGAGGLPPALFLTDPARAPEPETIAARLPQGFGVVYRHFGAPDRKSVVLRLAGICRARGLVLLIAADPALALQVDADGVHWPFRLRGEARRWRSRFRLQTLSAHSGRELRAAAGFPVDAVLLSTVFASRSPSAGSAIGALRFAKLAAGSVKPVYALGGLTAETAGLVAPWAGFASVDGMSAFTGATRTGIGHSRSQPHSS
jgi:thiamine-phosphate pyrophosphorylase